MVYSTLGARRREGPLYEDVRIMAKAEDLLFVVVVLCFFYLTSERFQLSNLWSEVIGIRSLARTSATLVGGSFGLAF